MWATAIAVPIFLGEADPVAGGRALSGGPNTMAVPGGLIPEPLLGAVFRIGPFHKGVRSLSPRATRGGFVCVGFRAVGCGQIPPLTDTPTEEWQGPALCPGSPERPDPSSLCLLSRNFLMLSRERHFSVTSRSRKC